MANLDEKNINDTINNVAGDLKDKVSENKDNLGNIADTLGDKFHENKDAIKDFAVAGVNKVEEVVTKNNDSEVAKSAFEKIKDNMDKLIDKGEDFIKDKFGKD